MIRILDLSHQTSDCDPERRNKWEWRTLYTYSPRAITMFVSRTAGERFPPDETRGPELRRGLDLFRVINRTGLQIRARVELDSEPCGRLYAGDVFCVNRSSTIPHYHHHDGHSKQGKRRVLRLTRLHMVQPYTGWVTGSSKWVEKFQQGDSRPGPIPLRSTLSDTCPVSMATSLGVSSVTSRCSPPRMGTHRNRIQGKGHCQGSNQRDFDGDRGPRAPTPRTRWLHSREGVWPVDVNSIPGPKYFPDVSAIARDDSPSTPGVTFPKEKRFLSNATRYLSRSHERESLGQFSPGPATYGQHSETGTAVSPRPPPPSSAPGSSHRMRNSALGSAGKAAGGTDCHAHKTAGSVRIRRAVTAGSIATRRERRRRRWNSGPAASASGPPYVGLKEQEAAERFIGKPKAGTTGSPVMRLLVSSRGEREGPDGCFVTRMGAASPGPARHVPKLSSMSPRGCPIFASPAALDPKDWERRKQTTSAEAHDCRKDLTKSLARPKTGQVHRRWPAYTHMGDEGRISGNLGQDSPGPGTVNVASYDPFRATSFLKMDVCHPPPACSSPASSLYRVPFG